MIERKEVTRVVLDLDAPIFEEIIRIVNVIGFSSVEDFVRVAIRREVDYYSILLGYKGTGK